jgi:hypothetical protein
MQALKRLNQSFSLYEYRIYQSLYSAYVQSLNTGLAEQDQLVFPFKNGVYGLVNDDNMPKASVFQWNRFTKTR